MSTVAENLGLPPGVHFSPDDTELVELYLLPLARGEPVPFAGVAVVDDDAAGRTLPWELFDRHGRGGEDDVGAYFLVRCGGGGEATKPGARQDRRCDGAGTWKSQKRNVDGTLRLDGSEEVHWSRHNLNLHVGRGGSVGWVMHEYVLTDPCFPPLKILRVSFTGHGKNRERVPGGVVDDDDCRSERATKRARVDAAAAAGGSASSGSGGSTTTTVDQDSGAPHAYADDQEAAAQAVLTGQDVSDWIDELFSDDFPGMSFATSVGGEPPCCFEEHVVQAAPPPPPATEQQVPDHAMMMPLPTVVQETAGTSELFAPTGLTLDEFSDMAGISDVMMDAGGQPITSVNWEGFTFY